MEEYNDLICMNCKFYKAYYIKGTTKYYKKEKGVCSYEYFEKAVKETYSCTKWESIEDNSQYLKRELEEILEDIANELSEIRRFLNNDYSK